MTSALRDYLPILCLIAVGLVGTLFEAKHGYLDCGPGAMLGAGLVLLWAVWRERRAA